MRLIELDSDRRRLILRFPYDPAVVARVRELPERRFDREERTWWVPCQHAHAVADALAPHGFALAPEVAALLGGAEAAAPNDSSPAAPGPTFRVSELNAVVRHAIEEAFPVPVWVAGEIAGYDRNRHRRHIYFELVEKAEGEEKPRARVSVVLFESVRPRVERRLAEAPDPFELCDGIEVRLRVRVGLYEPAGSYQAVLEDLDPVHTLGRLALARQQILRTLAARGLEDRNRSRPLPALPLRVALITSFGSDAMNDVLQELAQSGYAFSIAVFDARMQGRELKATVAAGLEHFARRAADHDVLVLARGGGARTDLVWFDDLDLAVAVAEHPLKVICGIGHQRDQSVLDLIATSVKTPTAAAQLLAARVREAEGALVERLARIAGGARAVVGEQAAALRRSGRRIALATGARFEAARRDLEHRVGLVVRGGRGALRSARSAAHNRVDRLAAAARVATRLAGERAARAVRALAPERVQVLFARAGRQAAAREERLRALDPAGVLRRGFALVRDGEGRLVTGVDRVAAGDDVTVQLRDGELAAGITGIRRRPEAAPPQQTAPQWAQQGHGGRDEVEER